MSAPNALYLLIDDRLKRDELQLPGLPETAERVRAATLDNNCSLHELAQIIQHDAALSARLIRLANSAYLGGRNRAESLMQALTRIGLRRIRTLALAMAVEQVFLPRNDIVREFAANYVQQTREVAAAAAILTQQLQKLGRSHRLHPDVALLAGMVSNIGLAPVLKLVDEFDDSFANPSLINQTMLAFGPKLGVNVLKHWQFTPNLIKVPHYFRKSRISLMDNPEDVSYCDIVHLASLLTNNAEPEPAAMTIAEYEQCGVLPGTEFWQQDATQQAYRQMVMLLT
ncbi:HDOD domain-containing protein [Idiomarina seosinensis]|uniref:HDOD domain-containing protein n=1 Tax=Idiomarina seosinensis TaxID=281739 RepID=UPI00384AB4CC